MEKNRADVVICGSNYLLSSDKSEERIKEVAKYVDEELRATSKALNVNPNFKAAVLTALNIAEKMMDNTDMTPCPPSAITGTVISSLPDHTARALPHAARIRSALDISVDASLIPQIFGTDDKVL